jgi:hypothetical protein
VGRLTGDRLEPTAREAGPTVPRSLVIRNGLREVIAELPEHQRLALASGYVDRLLVGTRLQLGAASTPWSWSLPPPAGFGSETLEGGVSVDSSSLGVTPYASVRLRAPRARGRSHGFDSNERVRLRPLMPIYVRAALAAGVGVEKKMIST